MAEAAVVEAMRPGDHISWIVEDDASLGRILAAYVGGAVPARHKVGCFVHALSPADTLAQLDRAGLDVDTLLRRGQLEIGSCRDAYLGSGRFDAEAMTDLCLRACAEARAQGYAGLRLVGDMSWAGDATGDDLTGYEARVNSVYAGGFAIGLCLYDRRVFEADRLSTLLAAHPASVDGPPDDDRPWTPLLRMSRSDDAHLLRLDGEVDISNRNAVLAILDTLEPQPPATDRSPARPLTLDVRALRFVDAASAHHMIAAATRTGGLRIVGASAQLTRLLEFAGASHVPGLVLAPA